MTQHDTSTETQTQAPPHFKRTVWLIAGVLTFTYLYAALRYVVFGPYSVNALPIFIMNKALAFSFVINLYILSSPYIVRIRRSLLGIVNYIIGTVHAILSVILIPGSYLKKFYTVEGEMNVNFGAMVFFGIIAFILMVVISKGFQYRNKYSQFWLTFIFEKLFMIFLIILGLHIFVYGVENWISWDKWYGGMPPISLLAFLFLLGTTFHFFQRIFCKKE